MSFDALWAYATRNGEIVQERTELEYIYNLMLQCKPKTYLEVGTAEGNSLYVLGSTVEDSIDFIDYGEKHTEFMRLESIGNLQKMGKTVTSHYGDSTIPCTLPPRKRYDCVFIDGGHDFATVLSDAILYATLADKYIFFHDIQLPEVRSAFEWFAKRWNLGQYSTFIHSPSYGYGIVEVGK